MRDEFLFGLFFFFYIQDFQDELFFSNLICYQYFYSLVLQQNWNFSIEKVLIQHIS